MTGQVAGKLPHQPTVPPRPGDNQGGQKHPGSSMLPRPSLADPQKPRSCRTGRRPNVEPMQSQTQITPFGATEDGNHVCQIADQIGGYVPGRARLRLLSVTGYRQPPPTAGRVHACRLTT